LTLRKASIVSRISRGINEGRYEIRFTSDEMPGIPARGFRECQLWHEPCVNGPRRELSLAPDCSHAVSHFGAIDLSDLCAAVHGSAFLVASHCPLTDFERCGRRRLVRPLPAARRAAGKRSSAPSPSTGTSPA